MDWYLVSLVQCCDFVHVALTWCSFLLCSVAGALSVVVYTGDEIGCLARRRSEDPRPPQGSVQGGSRAVWIRCQDDSGHE